MRLPACLVAALVLLTGAAQAQAQVLPDGPVLAAADLREGQDLSGEWTYSIDPYRDGQAGFHGGEPGRGHRRYDDIDVAEARAAEPLALFEYDMDLAPTAQIPSSWLTHAPEMRHYQGLVWYQRRFDAAPAPDKRQFIRFGAVNYAASVWLNGEYLGHHEGGFTPFVFEVTGKLRASGNRLVVGADSARTDTDVPPPVTDWETYGGITRPVRLISVPQTFVSDAWIRLHDRDTLAVDLQLDGPQAANRSVTVRMDEFGVAQQVDTDADGRASFSIPRPRGAQLWSPNSPRLYDVAIEAGADTWRDRIGLRTVEVDGPRIFLNGEPVFLRGISVHEEELGPNPSRTITPTAARELLSLVKDGLNGNFVRLAHYPHSDAMLRAADEMGLLVWSEIPVYWRVAFDNPETLDRARTMLAENVLRDRNRASVILWSVGNETPVSDPRNAFLRRLVADVRALDPQRLVTAALLTGQEGEGASAATVIDDPLAADLDVLAVNTYNGWYSGHTPAQVPAIRWRAPANKPLVFSEFGAGAAPGLHAKPGEEPIKFTEEYQADYYRGTLAMAETIPTLAGMSPWILKDFRSPRRQLPGVQDGWNRKGLVGEEGQRKLAFDVLADWYASVAEQ